LKLIDFHLLRWSAQQRLFTLLGALTSMLKTSAHLRLENLALRQQLTVLRRSAPKRLKLTPADRIFWVWLRRVLSDWKSTLMIVKAETVVAWHRKGFRLFWTWKIGRGKPGRPSVPQEIRDLIRMMSRNNPRWFDAKVAEIARSGLAIPDAGEDLLLVHGSEPVRASVPGLEQGAEVGEPAPEQPGTEVSLNAVEKIALHVPDDLNIVLARDLVVGFGLEQVAKLEVEMRADDGASGDARENFDMAEQVGFGKFGEDADVE
jgi:hypothetical protein